MREVGRSESDAILGAMRQVALAGGHAITYADTTSVLAAARYLLRRRDLLDIGTLPAVEPQDLASILRGKPELAREAVKYLAIMALVDGVLDHRKLARVLDYSRALDVEADYLTDLVEAASGHLAWAAADMWRKNFDSVLSRSSAGLDPNVWIRPYEGANADPRSSRATTRWASCRKTRSARHCGTSTRGTAIRSPAIRRRSMPPSGQRTIPRT